MVFSNKKVSFQKTTQNVVLFFAVYLTLMGSFSEKAYSSMFFVYITTDCRLRKSIFYERVYFSSLCNYLVYFFYLFYFSFYYTYDVKETVCFWVPV